MKRPNQKDVDAAIAELDKVRRSWLRRPGVTAVDVGYKISNDQLTDTLAIRVHVARKIPVAELAASEVFSEEGKANKLGRFPVDVIEAVYGPGANPAPLALEDHDPAAEPVNRRARFDPLVGGISVGNPRITAGTLGAIVYDRASCAPMILSNWHVLAGASAASAGEAIIQPGRADGGVDPADRVATLDRFVLDSRMDAAVARLDGVRGIDREMLELGVTISGITDAALGMEVVKSGRTTAVTRAVVDGVSMSVSINYGDPGVVTLSNQVHLVPRPPWPAVDDEISMGGDSGSVWIEEATGRAVGLHFAGETSPAVADEMAIANPIRVVVEEFNISFRPVICFDAPPWRPFDPWFDLCRRYPWICEGRIPWPPKRWPWPDPDPRVFDPRFGLDPRFDPRMGFDPRMTGPGAPGAGKQDDCGCGGGG